MWNQPISPSAHQPISPSVHQSISRLNSPRTTNRVLKRIRSKLVPAALFAAIFLASVSSYSVTLTCTKAALIDDYGPLMIPATDPEFGIVNGLAAAALGQAGATTGIQLRPTGTRNIPLSPIDLGQANTGAALATVANAGLSLGFGTFCRVTGEIYTSEGAPQYSVDGKCNNCSVISFEVRLPHNSFLHPAVDGGTWNGKYFQQGGAGTSGSLTGSAGFSPGFNFTSTDKDSPLSAAYPPPPGVPSGNNPGEWKGGGYVIAATDRGIQSDCNRPLQSSPFIPGVTGGNNGTNCADINQLSDGSAAFVNNDGTQNVTRWNNYNYRGNHLLAIVAKEIINRYYGVGPSLSVHAGFSAGGAQGLVAADRYPSDFDAILAGAPAARAPGMPAGTAGTAITQKQFPGVTPAGCDAANRPICLASQVIPTAGLDNLLPYIAKITMAVCDPRDGLTDLVLSDPGNCNLNFGPNGDFDDCPTTGPIPRDGAGLPQCLTAAQKDVLKTMYSDLVVPGTSAIGRGYFPGYEFDPRRNLASVTLGVTGATGTPPTARPTLYSGAEDAIRYHMFSVTDPSLVIQPWSLAIPSGFDFAAQGYCFAEQCGPFGPTYFVSGNLTSFAGFGGKLLVFHGLADPVVAPQRSIDLYQQVVSSFGGLQQARQSVRFFLVPGRSHGTNPGNAVAGAPANVGPLAASNTVNTGWMKALEKWIASGIAPDSVLGENSVPAPITRPICAYPFKAVHNGSGDNKVAANWTCKEDSHLGVSPTSISQTVLLGAQANQNLAIGNLPQAGGPSVGMNWTISEHATDCNSPTTEDIPWLSVSTMSGLTFDGPAENVAVNLNSTNLSAGTHTAKLCITGTNAYQTQLVEKFEVPVTLTVNYNYGAAFLPPIENPNVVNIGKAGRTYTVKFQLRDANGALVSALSAVTSINHQTVACDAFGGSPTDALPEADATGSTALRFDGTQFIFNWKTPSVKACYNLFVMLDSGQVLPAYFDLTK